MSFFRKIVLLLVMGIFVCGGLFASDFDIFDTYFNGDELNDRINRYIKSVSNLIPDTSTLQNVWARVPKGGFYLGMGMNGSMAFLSRTEVGSFISGGSNAFGADNIDLAQFPDGVPFLPGISLDVRIGISNLDVGVSGMWIDEKALRDMDITFFGEGSTFALQSLGFDVRYTLMLHKVLTGNQFKPFLFQLWPYFTFQAGYYYTAHRFGITADSLGRKESVDVDFRNDSFLLGLQISRDFFNLIAPYAGFKVIISKTDSEFTWETNRPVMISGRPYFSGAKYESAGKQGGVDGFSQLVFGLDLSYNLYSMSLGAAYTLGTDHFSINAAFRVVVGN